MLEYEYVESSSEDNLHHGAECMPPLWSVSGISELLEEVREVEVVEVSPKWDCCVACAVYLDVQKDQKMYQGMDYRVLIFQ